jgi:hypothetical protein
MASLKKVVEQLQENKEAQDETTDQVTGLSGRIGELIKGMRIDKLDLLETLREKKSQPAPRQAAAVAGSGGGGGFNLAFLGLGGLAPALSALSATLIATAASFTGLDDAIRAVAIGKILNSFRIGFLNVIKTITRIPGTILEVFKPLAKLPGAIKAAFLALPDSILKALKTFAVVGFGDIAKDVARVKTAISNFFKPVGNFFRGIRKFLSPVIKGIGGIVEAAKGVLTPIVDFLKNVANVLSPLLKPFIGFVKLVARPFVQILLSVIDFFVGFVKGFRSEKEGEFTDKLTKGIEGGIKGVIKGITDAVDLIFVDLPAFIAEKLGFKSFANTLREFSLTDLVDPAFEAVKNFFKLAFSDPREAFAPMISAFKNLPLDFMKKILRAILPNPDMFKITFPSVDLGPLGKFGGGVKDLNPFPEAIYKFAGLDPLTGKDPVIPQPSTTGTAVENSGFKSFGPPNMQILDQSSRTGDTLYQNQGLVMQQTSAFDRFDPYLSKQFA